MTRLLLSLMLLFAALPAPAAALQLPPFDEAAQDPAFKQFRDALLDAARHQNLEHLLAATAVDVRLGFGGRSGVEQLRRDLTAVDGALLWAELEDTLAHGGAFNQQGGFDAPYWFAEELPLPDGTDRVDVRYVVGETVRMRAGPGSDHPVVATLSYEVVLADDLDEIWSGDPDGHIWYKVRTLDGRKGWIREDFLRGHYSFRAGFEQRDGRWLMTYFLAGD